MLILLTAFHTLHIFYLSLTDFQNFPGLFPGLSSPGKCHNKIPGLSRCSRTHANPACKIYLLPGLLLNFESPVALLSTPVTKFLLCGWILPTKSNFTRSVKRKSSILCRNRHYRPVTAVNDSPALPSLQTTSLAAQSIQQKRPPLMRVSWLYVVNVWSNCGIVWTI